jgi:hypothetical protein
MSRVPAHLPTKERLPLRERSAKLARKSAKAAVAARKGARGGKQTRCRVTTPC